MATVLHRLNQWAIDAPAQVAQRYRDSKGDWVDISSKGFRDSVFYLAAYLESKGFGEGDVSSILSYNSPAWVYMDLAPSLLGGLSAGMYPNASLKEMLYVLNDTQSKVFAVQNKEYFDKLQGQLPDFVETVIVIEGDAKFSPKAVSWKTVMKEGKKLTQGMKMESYLQKLDKDKGAFLIYTSGTTGNPKGAVLTHGNLAFTSDAVIRHWDLYVGHGPTMFSFLPLSHIAEKLQNTGAGLSCRYTVSFCSKFENLAQDLGSVQPTVLLAVPRVWEKMMEGVEIKLKSAPEAKKKLAAWAFGVGERVAEARFEKKTPALTDMVQLAVAKKLVLGKVLQALGLAQIEKAASGAAPLPPHVAKWFRKLGIEILEAYGQTETTGVITVTIPGEESAGTVGVPPEGVELKLAEDGEIFCRGRNVFKGYYRNEEATKETLVDGGWLATGDLAVRTPQGFIQIRGRKKEIMKTSGGKMTAPLPIEEKLKESPLINQVCMVGDGKKYFTALITLDEATMKSLEKKENGAIQGRTVKDPKIISEIKKKVDEVNSELAAFERVKYFTILSKDFSLEDGEMTPTMKMKRNVVEERHRDVIESMYS
jgi:long-subunit acyl-CoA synthetase (AMP-forming)